MKFKMVTNQTLKVIDEAMGAKAQYHIVDTKIGRLDGIVVVGGFGDADKWNEVVCVVAIEDVEELLNKL